MPRPPHRRRLRWRDGHPRRPKSWMAYRPQRRQQSLGEASHRMSSYRHPGRHPPPRRTREAARPPARSNAPDFHTPESRAWHLPRSPRSESTSLLLIVHTSWARRALVRPAPRPGLLPRAWTARFVADSLAAKWKVRPCTVQLNTGPNAHADKSRRSSADGPYTMVRVLLRRHLE